VERCAVEKWMSEERVSRRCEKKKANHDFGKDSSENLFELWYNLIFLSSSLSMHTQDMFSVVIVIFGLVFTALGAPIDQVKYTSAVLLSLYTKTPFIIFGTFVALIVAILLFVNWKIRVEIRSAEESHVLSSWKRIMFPFSFAALAGDNFAFSFIFNRFHSLESQSFLSYLRLLFNISSSHFSYFNSQKNSGIFGGVTVLMMKSAIEIIVQKISEGSINFSFSFSRNLSFIFFLSDFTLKWKFLSLFLYPSPSLFLFFS